MGLSRSTHRRWLRFGVLCFALTLVGIGRCSPAGDRDGDFALDPLDNCLWHPNTDQRDTDGDGIGNACDPDFDQDGRVTEADLALMDALLDRLASGVELDVSEARRARDFDLDGDGVVDIRDRKGARKFRGKPPGPRSDGDDDGVADREDPCLDSLPGFPQLLPGCAALEIAQEPERVVGPVKALLMELTRDTERDRDAPAVAILLDEALASMDRGVLSLRGGDPCGGGDPFRMAGGSLATASRELLGLRLALEGDVYGASVEGDFSDAEERILTLAEFRQRVRFASVELDALAGAFDSICTNASPFVQREEKIWKIDAAPRRLHANGTYVLAQDLRTTGTIAAGVRARLTGFDLGAAGGFVAEADAIDTVPGILAEECVVLRFVPVQRAYPLFPGPYVLHDPRGYQNGPSFDVELGMGLAVESVCEEHGDFQYFLELSFVGGSTLAPEIDEHDQPVLLPFNSPPFVTLRARTLRSFCPAPPLCQIPEELADRTYDLVVFGRGVLALGVHADPFLDVDDRNPQHFRTTEIAGVIAPFVPGSNLQFRAEARNPNGSGSKIMVGTGQPFAVHVHDFYPVDPYLWPFFAANVIAAVASGVDHAAGLAWPRLTGTRAGFPFWYSVRLTELVRDVVNFGCSGTPYAFHRMPFAESDPNGPSGWTVAQGAKCSGLSGCANHANSWSWDLASPCDSALRAIRAGRADFVVDFNSCQMPLSPPCQGCNSACCDTNLCIQGDPLSPCIGNYIRVRHQDDSLSQYAHIAPNSVLVNYGEKVPRGGRLGSIGETGNAFGPHTHWSTWTPPSGAHLALFEAVQPNDPGTALTCYLPPHPASGPVPLRSNNAAPN